MIARDQPDIFGSKVCVSVSSRVDGTMLNRQVGIGGDVVLDARRKFVESNSLKYSDTVFQWVNYTPGARYDQIVEVDERSTTRYTDGVPADALMTRSPGVGLFLPIADCIATVIYDPDTHRLALLHMGRHSTLTNLIHRVIERFRAWGAKPANLKVWMSPHVSRKSYRLEYFSRENDPSWSEFITRQPDGIYIDMSGYNRRRLIDNGVSESNIDISSVDTATSPDYFSHSMGNTTERFAVLAYLR